MEIKEVINKTKKVEDGNFYNQNLSSALIEDGAEVLQQGNIVEDGNFYNQNLSSALIEQDDDILGDLHVDETDIYDTTLSSALIEDEILQSLNGDLTLDEDCNVLNLSLSSSLIDDEVTNSIDGDLTVDEVSNIINLSISSSLIDDEVSNSVDGDLTVDEESFYNNEYQRTIDEVNGIIVPDTYKFVLTGSSLVEYYTPQLLNGVFSDLQYSDLTTVNNSLSEDIVFTDGENNYNCTVSVSSRADNGINGTDDYAPHNLFAPADKRTSDIPGVCGTDSDLIYTGQFTTPLPFDLLSNLSLDFGVVPRTQSASASSKQLYEIRIYCKKVDRDTYVGFSDIRFANGTLVSTQAGSTPLRSGDVIINFNGDDVNVHLTVSNRDGNCTEPLVNALNGGGLYLQGYAGSSYGVEFDYVMTFEDPVYLTDLNFYMTTYMPSDTRGFARSIRFEIYSYTVENDTKNYTLVDTINYSSEDRYKTITVGASMGAILSSSLTNKLYYEVFDSNNSSVLLKSYYNGNFSTNENVSFGVPKEAGLYTIELYIPTGVNGLPVVSDAVFANLTYDRCNSARNATATSEEIVFTDEVSNEYTCTISVTSRWRDNGSDDYAPHNLFAPSNKRVSSMGAVNAANSSAWKVTIDFTTPIALSKLAGLSIYAGWHNYASYSQYDPTIEYTLYKNGIAIYNETAVNATSRGDYQMTFTPFNQSN